MATSKSEAQTPLSCQLCSIQRVIKWKCTECELLMCDICKTTVHSRIKTAEKHNIITIQEVGTDLSERLKALNISEVFSSVFNTYTTDVSGIHKLICCSDDIIYYMSNKDGQTFRFLKAKLLKASIKNLQNFDIECVDFAISEREEVLFSPAPGTKLIATSTTSTNTEILLDMSPLLILAIHISKHCELLIGLREQGPRFPVTRFSKRQVAIFGTNYKRKSTLKNDDEVEKLFNYTYRIATDSANNIYVIDLLNDDNLGRIVSIDRNGHKRFNYNGCISLNTQAAVFNPEDIVVTFKDTIIISDCINHALHALNTNGELIGIQITRNLDILYPYSLSIDNEGFMLIGSGLKQGGTIHVVKLLQL